MSRRTRQWGEDSVTTVELSGGALVTVSFKGNLFDLTPEERNLIADLSHNIQMFNKGAVAELKEMEAQHDETRT